LYTGGSYGELNRGFRRQNLKGWNVPFALLLQVGLTKYLKAYEGELSRGTWCDAEKLQQQVGNEIKMEHFISFSKNLEVALKFRPTIFPANNQCIVKMNLAKNNQCAFDITKISVNDQEEEVLMPFNTKVKLVSIEPNNAEAPEYYNVVWECLDNVSDEGAKSNLRLAAL